MYKFKVGDLIKCIDVSHNPLLIKDKTYEVVGDSAGSGPCNMVLIRAERGVPDRFFNKRFELVIPVSQTKQRRKILI